jgi:hypothetical protein
MKRYSALFAFLLLPIFSLRQSAVPSKPSLAIVDGQPLTDEDLAPYVQSQLRPLREQEYQIKKKGLDTLITQRVIEAEAKKKGLTTDKLLEQGVDARVAEPTDVELNAIYAVQKEQINRTVRGSENSAATIAEEGQDSAGAPRIFRALASACESCGAARPSQGSYWS